METTEILVGQPDYDFMAAQLAGDRLLFLNHGCSAPRGAPVPALQTRHERHRSFVNLLVRTVAGSDLRNRRVLDVSCGRGGNALMLHLLYRPRQVVGLDRSAGNIRFCRASHRARSLSFVKGDAQKLPFAESRFDFVLNVDSSYAYPDRSRFYREVFRVLKPPGKFGYTDMVSPERLLRYERDLTQAGLTILDREDLTRATVAAIRARRDKFLIDLLNDPQSRDRRQMELLLGYFHSIHDRALRSYDSGQFVAYRWLAMKGARSKGVGSPGSAS